jgi:threonine/homoserine efflux transporter RhtA
MTYCDSSEHKLVQLGICWDSFADLKHRAGMRLQPQVSIALAVVNAAVFSGPVARTEKREQTNTHAIVFNIIV